jgi:hypothetical protein
MDEVKLDTSDGGLKLPEAVERALLFPPIEAVLPVAHELSKVRQIGSELPRVVRRFVGPSRLQETLPKVIDLRLRDGNLEPTWRAAIPPGARSLLRTSHALSCQRGLKNWWFPKPLSNISFYG